MSYEFEVGSTQYRVTVAAKGASLRVAVNAEAFAVEVLGRDADGRLRATVDGKLYHAVIKRAPTGELQVFLDGRAVSLLPPRRAPPAKASRSTVAPTPSAATIPGTVPSPIPGRVVLLRVRAGDTVKPGDPLAVLESMKMESTVHAPRGGRVTSIAVTPGQTVQRGQPLVTLA